MQSYILETNDKRYVIVEEFLKGRGLTSDRKLASKFNVSEIDLECLMFNEGCSIKVQPKLINNSN